MSSTFRYPNDNRGTNPSDIDYPGQNEIDPSAEKGQPNYYGNDNGGYYANSNRNPDLSVPDATAADFQPPNSNVDLQNT